MNDGLLARWHTALPYLEGVCAMPEARHAALEQQWTEGVVARLEAFPNLVVEAAEKGIVSISCAKAAGGGEFHGTPDLKKVHKWMTMDMIAAPGASSCAAATKPMLIGQPVKLHADASVLRIALGAELLLEMDGGSYEPASELPVMQKLSWLVERFGTLDAHFGDGSM